MKSIFYLLFAVLLWLAPGMNQLYSQSQTEIDSLSFVLQKNPADSSKIDLYLELHQAYIPMDTSRSLAFLNQAISLGRKIGDRKRICRSYLKLGNYYWKKGRLRDAKKALVNAEQQLSFLKDPQMEATFFLEQGLVNYFEGTYQEAVENFFKAMKRYEIVGDTLGVAKCYSNIGISYWEMENLDEALENYLKGLKIIEKTSDSISLARSLGNIGLIYSARNDYEHALEYYQRSLAINRKNKYIRDAAIDLQNISVIYQKKGEYDRAFQYLAQSRDLSASIDDQGGILYTRHGMATLLAKMGKYQEAIPMLQEALELAKTLKMKEAIKNIYESFASIHEDRGHYKLALDSWKNYQVWKDSLAGENHLNQVKELELKYETEKKDNQINLLTFQNELQEAKVKRQAIFRNALIGGVILTLIIAALVIFSLRHRLKSQRILSRKNEEIRISNFNQQISELELKAIKAQMNPHFVFNCMNSINRMILNGRKLEASRYLTKFSGLIRKVLENSESSRVTLNDELAILESYLRLEQLRFKDKIKHKLEIDPGIDPDTTYIPSMILQPVIENAIWHGLMHKKEGGEISVFMEKEDSFLKCRVEDNGVGREVSKLLKTENSMKNKSFGLDLTEKRLRLMSRTELLNPIRIEDLKDQDDQVIGTRVNLLIPIT